MTVQLLHSDAVIIVVSIKGAEVRRLLVDSGRSCYILFLEAFSRVGIDPQNLKPRTWVLVGFVGHEVPVVGMIAILLSIEEWPKVSTKIIDFLIVDPIYLQSNHWKAIPWCHGDHILSEILVDQVSYYRRSWASKERPTGITKHVLDRLEEEGRGALSFVTQKRSYSLKKTTINRTSKEKTRVSTYDPYKNKAMKVIMYPLFCLMFQVKLSKLRL